jgi:hypothetical protein
MLNDLIPIPLQIIQPLPLPQARFHLNNLLNSHLSKLKSSVCRYRSLKDESPVCQYRRLEDESPVCQYTEGWRMNPL